MVKSAVRVVLRARPASSGASNIQFTPDKRGINITLPGKPNNPLDKGPQQYQFKFDNVLSNASQEDVYETCAADVLQHAFEGYNGTIMCYGQTGAGKTFTMTGNRTNFAQRGIIPRLLTQLFMEIKKRTDMTCSVQISYLEIYNENLYDLLDISTQPHEINVYETAAGRVHISGLRCVPVSSEAEALALLFEGDSSRVIGEHQLNRESSRSHSIFSVGLTMKSRGEEGQQGASRVHLVDLAGSERVSKTKSEGLVLREAGQINKSLSILEQVILALSDRGRDHVPYRSSKLTQVLRDSLGGNCRTVMVANVWSDTAQVEETLSTCRFAQRMARVTCEVTQNVEADMSARSKQLEREVAALKQELAMHDSLVGRTPVMYSAYSDAQRQQLREQVLAFLSQDSLDSVEPLELLSLRHMREILFSVKAVFKEMRSSARSGAVASSLSVVIPPNVQVVGGGRPLTYSRSSNDGQQPGSSHYPTTSTNGHHPTTSTPPMHPTSAGSAGSGSRRSSGSGGVSGGAEEAAGPRPPSPSPAAVMERYLAMQQQQDTQQAQQGGAQHASSTHNGGGGALSAGPSCSGPAPDRRQAFEDYKLGPGSYKAQLQADNRAKLKQVKARAKALALSINAVKREIDTLKTRLDTLTRNRLQQRGGAAAGGGGGADLLATEEYEGLMRLRELKTQYRDEFNELQMVKSEVSYSGGLLDAVTQELIAEFSAWYAASYGADVGSGAALLGGEEEEWSPRSGAGSSSNHVSSSSGGGLPPPGPSFRAATSTASPAPTYQTSGSPSTAALSSPGGGAAGRPSPAPPPLTSASGPPSKPRKVLASLVPPDDCDDPNATLYYNAQQVLMANQRGGANSQGSRSSSVTKQQRTKTTFSTSERF